MICCTEAAGGADGAGGAAGQNGDEGADGGKAGGDYAHAGFGGGPDRGVGVVPWVERWLVSGKGTVWRLCTCYVEIGETGEDDEADDADDADANGIL